MSRDFTFEIYEELLQASLEAGYEHLTVREYIGRKKLPEKFIIHRHDVDRKPENALAMAQIEARNGISSTYYFRTIEKTFRLDLIPEIEKLGHEIGYHYEDMDRADGDVDLAHQSFEAELARMRAIANIDTVCMHGNPLTRYDNRDMWANRSPSEYGLLGEAYISMDFVDVTYFSDTGRTWVDGDLKVKDHPVGESQKNIQVEDTNELIRIINDGEIHRLCLLSHPNRWAATKSEYMAELAKDTTTNVGKTVLTLLR
ncbi:hypothetical protein [Natronococcus jeotgali]|uniref:Polysaccharide deacetylase n=1 Tax=Natronococcus jeotgali DSM 18795 TaxID=1227498 RepID=L9X3S5_9EURY|nr:hypothetical protein [Natronococcus jeotgali]ELY56414.1 hypothetical protein C492_14971 [Natronococcus jeotgali DSM 18795]